MASKITLVCFDINIDYEENFADSLGENILALECPLRILDEFIDKNLFLKSEKTIINSSEVKYTFRTNLSERNIIVEIFVLYDLSYIHEITLDADAYLLFTNLEKRETMDQLSKIIEYILENCSMELKTYVVGMYNDVIIPSLEKESMELYLEEENLNFEYYQIKCKNKSKKEIKEENKDNGQILRNNCQKEIKNDKKKTNLNIIDTVLTILKKVYDIKIKDLFEPSIKKIKYYSSNNFNEACKTESGCNCTIF